MFLSLQHWDALETGEPQPELAERWEHSKDYKEWPYFLRRDVKWHDGVQVTVHDIKFTMDLRKQLDLMPENFSVEPLDDLVVGFRQAVSSHPISMASILRRWGA